MCKRLIIRIGGGKKISHSQKLLISEKFCFGLFSKVYVCEVQKFDYFLNSPDFRAGPESF